MSQLITNGKWRTLLSSAVKHGKDVYVRGRRTLELESPYCLEIDMLYPVMTIPERKLSFRFMAAEAHWILTGDNRVSTIRPYCEKLAEYSDDGLTFFGAYGPRFVSQLNLTVGKLLKDVSTRQACITIWKENPPETKDTPCTVAMAFSIRENKLNNHVFMRSSDIWLGLPYDIFNFSMMAYMVCCRYNRNFTPRNRICPGKLFVTSASSHLYRDDLDNAEKLLLNSDLLNDIEEIIMPQAIYTYEESLLTFLERVKNSQPLLSASENLIKLGITSGLYEKT